MTETQTETTETTTPTETPEEGHHEGREAAKYRRALREAEAERDELRATVDSLRTTMCESALAGVLARPAALWLTGAKPGDYFTEDGTLDADALTAAARDAVRSHGIGPYKRFQGSADGGARQDATPPASTWRDALRG